jgi:hypothetical protein
MALRVPRASCPTWSYPWPTDEIMMYTEFYLPVTYSLIRSVSTGAGQADSVYFDHGRMNEETTSNISAQSL